MALSAALAAPREASAEERASEPTDPEERAATALFAEAIQLAQAGRWAEARDRYQRSLEVKFAPETLYSLAVAQKQTGAYVEALDSFERFLDAPAHGELAPFRRAAEQAQRDLAGRVGRIAVRVAHAPHRLAIAIDGRTVTLEQAGAGFLVNPGHHTVEATAPDMVPRMLTLEVAPGEHERVQLDYGGDPAPHSAVGWTLVGVGIGMGSAGLATGLFGATLGDHSNADQARTATIAAATIGSLGVLTAGVGALLLTGGSTDAPPKAVTASLGPGGIGLEVRF